MYNIFGLRVPAYSNNMVLEKGKVKTKIDVSMATKTLNVRNNNIFPP